MPLIIPGNSQASTGYTIDQSIRFNDDDSAYMSRTFSASNRKTLTFSCWVKRGTQGTNQNIFGPETSLSGSGTYGVIRLNPQNELDIFDYTNGTTNWRLQSTQLLRDSSAWYHFVFSMDTSNAVSSERLRMYINGERVTDFDVETYPSLNYEGQWNNNLTHQIGAIQRGTSNQYFDGYLAEIHFLDGYAYDPSFFGEFNSSGIWIPKEYTGSYGTNGFYIKGQLAGATNAITALGNIQHSTAQAKIGSSSILFDGNGDLLEVGGTSNWYDFGADGNPWTMEAYIRFDTVSITQKIFWQNNTYIGIEYVTGSGIKVRLNNGGINFTASWSPSINTWYHIAVVRQTNNTTTVYIDGTSIGSGTISGGSSSQHKVEIGAFSPSTDEFDGYMDEIRISSVARFTSSFTPTTSEYTADGDTLALIHSNTTNGSTVFKNDVGFGNDSSGNQNNFATSGLAVHDQVSDSPSNNFAVLNPLDVYSTSPSNGNLKYAGSNGKARASVGIPKSGKWYWEVRADASRFYAGLISLTNVFSTSLVITSNAGSGYYTLERQSTTNSFYNASTSSTSLGSQTLSSGDVMAFAYDSDTRKLWIGYDGGSGSVAWYSSGDPASGSNELATLADDEYSVFVFDNSSLYSTSLNFGQEGTFGGTETAGGNSDSSGIGNFFYSVPTGFKALCTKNLGS